MGRDTATRLPREPRVLLFLHRLGRRLGVLPVVYTLANGAAFTYHDNSNLMGRQLGLRVRQPHGLSKVRVRIRVQVMVRVRVRVRIRVRVMVRVRVRDS
jgi:hypothetical protein